MANIKYIVKDPSFRYFAVGLLLFIIITAGGIMAIKNLANKPNQQPDTISIKEPKDSKKPDNIVIIDDADNSQSSDQSTSGRSEVEVTTTPSNPDELARTGGSGVLSALGLAALTYAVVLALQKR